MDIGRILDAAGHRPDLRFDPNFGCVRVCTLMRMRPDFGQGRVSDVARFWMQPNYRSYHHIHPAWPLQLLFLQQQITNDVGSNGIAEHLGFTQPRIHELEHLDWCCLWRMNNLLGGTNTTTNWYCCGWSRTIPSACQIQQAKEYLWVSDKVSPT